MGDDAERMHRFNRPIEPADRAAHEKALYQLARETALCLEQLEIPDDRIYYLNSLTAEVVDWTHRLQDKDPRRVSQLIAQAVPATHFGIWKDDWVPLWQVSDVKAYVRALPDLGYDPPLIPTWRFREHAPNWDILYVLRNPDTRTIKFGITSDDERSRLGKHRRDGYTETVRLLRDVDGKAIEDAVKATLRLAGEVPTRGREYFPEHTLGIVLDIVDNWKE